VIPVVIFAESVYWRGFILFALIFPDLSVSNSRAIRPSSWSGWRWPSLPGSALRGTFGLCQMPSVTTVPCGFISGGFTRFEGLGMDARRRVPEALCGAAHCL